MLNNLGTLVHRLSGWLLLSRLLVFDLLWLLPRQPVTYFLAFGTPRLLQVYLPNGYAWFGHWFDGDATPHIWVASLLALAICGGLSRATLWPESKTGRFLSVVGFVLVPLSWGIKTFLIHSETARIASHLEEAFSIKPNSSSFHLLHPFQLAHHLQNFHGGEEVLTPNFTIPYKNATMDHPSLCGGEGILDLPGDSFFTTHRGEMERGLLKMDVYLPRKISGSLPVLLHVHGGGWKKGDRRFISINYHGGMPHMLLNQGKVIIASIAYRLSCSGVSEPSSMVEDIYDAIEFIKSNAHSWSGDGSKIIPWGTSAGGNLVLNAAFKYRHTSVVGVISHYGVAELRAEPIVQKTNGLWASFHSRLLVKLTRHLCSRSQKSDDECFSEISPIYHLESHQSDQKVPPVLIIHGFEDPIVLFDQAKWLADELSMRNISHALVGVHGSHDCDCHVSSACSQISMYSVDRFLDHILH